MWRLDILRPRIDFHGFCFGKHALAQDHLLNQILQCYAKLCRTLRQKVEIVIRDRK